MLPKSLRCGVDNRESTLYEVALFRFRQQPFVIGTTDKNKGVRHTVDALTSKYLFNIINQL